ncbi:Mediator of RNA polymerase II transcription subunit 16 [Chamberlinius hualienensis]
MDLVYTVSRHLGGKGYSRFEWPHEPGAVCSVSCRNAVAFSSTTQLDDVTGRTWKCHVYVADLNVPWETHLVVSLNDTVTCLEWDLSGSKLSIFTATGDIEIWTMKDYLLNEWTCSTSSSFPGELILRAAWFHHGVKTVVNTDKKDSVLYNEKFANARFGPSVRYFGGRPKEGCLAISITGMICVVILQSDGTAITTVESLSSLRSRLKVVDMCYGKNGDFLVAASDGTVSAAIQCYKVTLRLKQDRCIILSQPLPSFYSNCYTSCGSVSSPKVLNCTRVTHLRFVVREAADAVIVSSAGPNESVIELWELREKQIPLHKMFTNPTTESKLKTISWQHHASFRSSSPVMSLTTPRTSIYDTNPPPSYVFAAYKDSVIKCFYRESLQIIGTINVSPNLQYRDEAGAVQTGATVISDMQLTWTGNALIAIDSLSQLYVYRLSPITDPGYKCGPLTTNQAVNLLEYCLVTGIDWWDILISLRPGMVESICERLSDSFNRQLLPFQQYLFSRFLSIKISLFRMYTISSSGINSGQSKVGDCYALLMLNAVSNCFKSVLRPTDLSGLDKGPAENLTAIMTSKQYIDATDVDKIITNFEKEKDFCVEPATLQSLQPLIQWVANFTLYLLASFPQQYHNMARFPGGGLLGDIKALCTLRELLVIIRFWGLIRATCLPYFTKTAENLDVVSLLFKLLTKTLNCHGTEPDDSLIDECCLLPSQVLVPQLYLAVESLGVASPALAMNALPLQFEYNSDPDFIKYSYEPIAMEGSITTRQKYDVVRHIYMGSSPATYKQCTRCSSTSIVKITPKSAAMRAWDQRWARACPCGGQWKLMKSL